MEGDFGGRGEEPSVVFCPFYTPQIEVEGACFRIGIVDVEESMGGDGYTTRLVRIGFLRAGELVKLVIRFTQFH